MDKITDQTAYWDSVAAYKNFTIELDKILFKRYIKCTDKILDYGCGYGRIGRILKDDGYFQYYGADISKQMIKRGRNQNPDLKLFSVNELEAFETNFFDAVICVAVFTSIPNKELQEVIIEKIKRLLRPGGILYVIDYFLQNDDRNLQRYEAFKKKYNDYGVFELSTKGVMRHHTREYFDELTKDFISQEIVFKPYKSSHGYESCLFHSMMTKKEEAK